MAAFFILAFFAVAYQLAYGADDFQQNCLSFHPESYVFNSTRTVLEYVAAGTNVSFPDNVQSCARPYQVVSEDICRSALSIPTSNRSSITFELWLPRNWTGRFLATGNGGVDGCIKYEDLAYTSRNGFASAGANNGHNGTTGVAFLDNPDIIRDFADRSLHTTVQVGKALVKAFYARPHTKSYYIGCSLGGRQGFHAAELYPSDFDGIVAGSPALDFNNLYSWRASFYTITGPPNSSTFIPAATWQRLIHDEVLRQCDEALDGAADGILEDSSLCNFRPEALLCSSDTTNTTACLTPAQASTVRRIFSPFYGQDGTLIYPAMNPSSEIISSTGLYAGKPFSLSVDWFRYAIYSDPNWDPATFNFSSAAFANQLNPFNIRTFPTDNSSIGTFRDRGGKLITYHGGQDYQITSYDTPRWYDALARGTDSTLQELDAWVRFFRISGMGHCSGGPGAWVYGQGGASSAEGIPFEPSQNVLAAVIDWVENGVSAAPETMLGTKFKNDVVEQGVDFTRRHCRYPLRNTFLGGDYKDPDNWACR